MSKTATIIGSAAGALAFVILVIGFFWLCKSQSKNLSNRNSETGSLDPSALVQWNREAGQSSSSSYGQSLFALHGPQQFTWEELEQDTRKFNESNLLGYGSFSQVYKDTGLESYTGLEFKQRLTIALGAAKGLCHLHSLKPPFVRRNFKTANVLVDENFIAKVADAGVLSILEKIERSRSILHIYS